MALRETNLIPPGFMDRRILTRHLSLWGACLVLSLAAIWGTYARHCSLQHQGTGPRVTLKEARVRLTSAADELAGMRGKLDDLSFAKRIIRRDSCAEVLLTLSDIMNVSTWLTEFVMDSPAEAGGDKTLRLTGFSFSNADMGEFLGSLSDERMFRAPVLKFALEGSQSGWSTAETEPRRLVRFQIDCVVAGEGK